MLSYAIWKYSPDMYSVFILENTQVLTEPLFQEIETLGVDVVLECRASTDMREATHLTYQWTFFREEIDFENELRFFFNATDHSLTIVGIEELDLGVYECTVDNGIDSDDVFARLRMAGKVAIVMKSMEGLLEDRCNANALAM